MVDMFTVHSECTAILHEYEGIAIQCNYCSDCCKLRISISCPKVAIFYRLESIVYETNEALTKLYNLFYDFISQPEIVEYLRRNKR